MDPSSPILIWQPAGGVPGGGQPPPVIDEGAITGADVTQLINGQSYIDVVFSAAQTDADWIFVECSVVNTTDTDPLNIWPGILTSKTTTGFRLQLNGKPDSDNYFLHWAIVGSVTFGPPPTGDVATTYTLTGPSSGTNGSPSTNFTAALPAGTTVPAPVTVTPHDAGAGGTFTPATVVLTTAAPSATFTYTPSILGDKVISGTNDGGLTNPGNLIYGVTGVPSGGALNDGDPVTVWPDMSGHANHLRQSGSACPIFKTNILNGFPAVRLTAAGLSSMNLTAPITSAGPYTMFAVMKPATAAKNIYTLASNTPTGADCLGVCELGSDLLFWSCKSYLSYLTPNPYDGAFHLFDAQIVSGASALYVDGVNVVAGVGSATATDDFAVFGRRPSDLTYSDGDVLELLVYNSLIAGSDLTAVRAYLLNKYFGTPGTFDPSTVAGMLGWWKADRLSTSLFTRIDTIVSGDNVRLMVPPAPTTNAVIWCHGLGGSEKNINDGSINEVYTVPTVNAGYLVAACNAFGYNWDNATAQGAVEALVAYLHTTYGITNIVMDGGSAGGPVGLLKATQGFPGVTVRGWHGVYPIVDLDAAHNNTPTSLPASINAAFPAYPTDAAGRDPALFPGTAYNGLRLLCCQSPDDTVAPKAQHGDVLVALATGHATEVTCVATTGDHGDLSNHTPALADAFIAFLLRCFP